MRRLLYVLRTHVKIYEGIVRSKAQSKHEELQRKGLLGLLLLHVLYCNAYSFSITTLATDTKYVVEHTHDFVVTD